MCVIKCFLQMCKWLAVVHTLDGTALNKILVQSQLYGLLQVQSTPTAQRWIISVPSQYLYSVSKANSTVSYLLKLIQGVLSNICWISTLQNNTTYVEMSGMSPVKFWRQWKPVFMSFSPAYVQQILLLQT